MPVARHQKMIIRQFQRRTGTIMPSLRELQERSPMYEVEWVKLEPSLLLEPKLSRITLVLRTWLNLTVNLRNFKTSNLPSSCKEILLLQMLTTFLNWIHKEIMPEALLTLIPYPKENPQSQERLLHSDISQTGSQEVEEEPEIKFKMLDWKQNSKQELARMIRGLLCL